MRRRGNVFAEAWKGLVFIITIRAIAKHYRSRRPYLVGR